MPKVRYSNEAVEDLSSIWDMHPRYSIDRAAGLKIEIPSSLLHILQIIKYLQITQIGFSKKGTATYCLSHSNFVQQKQKLWAH